MSILFDHSLSLETPLSRAEVRGDLRDPRMLKGSGSGQPKTRGRMMLRKFQSQGLCLAECSQLGVSWKLCLGERPFLELKRWPRYGAVSGRSREKHVPRSKEGSLVSPSHGSP